MGVVLQSLIRRETSDGAIAQEPPYPTIFVITRFREYRANSECGGSVERRKGRAAGAPLVRITGLVGTLARCDVLQRVSGDGGEPAGLYHIPRLAVSVAAVDQIGVEPSAHNRRGCRGSILQILRASADG